MVWENAEKDPGRKTAKFMEVGVCEMGLVGDKDRKESTQNSKRGSIHKDKSVGRQQPVHTR